ncbi:thermostable hemolysin [Azonexus sp.]|uniref:thermostable hemolysin n=1 Tax=Azonexus sp. TaxID=1872668 RepID=UPI0027B96627|nr:thermostable hemolysin [Azonexus sp.]
MLLSEVIIVAAIQKIIQTRQQALSIRHTVVGAPQRAAAESFIADIFRSHYDAEVKSFAPNLMLLERAEQIVATAGWRCAGEDRLFLENYLDVPIETAVARLAGQPVRREAIVEVGNLAATRAGGSVDVILSLAAHLDRLGYEWVVFTATNELIGIFRRLGLPPLALAPADPSRLGEQAADWGSYYDSKPVVVAGRIRLALDMVKRHG